MRAQRFYKLGCLRIERIAGGTDARVHRKSTFRCKISGRIDQMPNEEMVGYGWKPRVYVCCTGAVEAHSRSINDKVTWRDAFLKGGAAAYSDKMCRRDICEFFDCDGSRRAPDTG